MKGRAAAFEALQGAPAAPQQPGSSASEISGGPAEPAEAAEQPGPQQHAAPRWALDTSGKQLLAFFDKDLLASGHAAMTTAADEGVLQVSSGLHGP